MHVRRITHVIELHSLAPAWNSLAGGIPFRLCEWNSTWWRHYGQQGQLYVLAVVDADGELLGVAPWYIENVRARGRVLRFLGSGEVCSDYQTILSRPGQEETDAKAVADYLCNEDPDADDETGGTRDWDLLQLSGVLQDDPVLRVLIGELAARGAAVHEEPTLNCWRIQFPPTWEEYEAMLSKGHRKQVRRLKRDYLDSGRAVLHTVEHREQLPLGWEILVHLHQRRWITQGELGVFHSPQFTAFHRDMAEQLLAKGKLRLHWLEIDGKLAAAEYHLASDDTIFAYQAGVEPELLDLEPGRVSNVATLQQAHAIGFKHFDYLRGDEPYKAHWRAQPQACINVEVVPPRLGARLRHGAWEAGRKLKRWVAGNTTPQE